MVLDYQQPRHYIQIEFDPDGRFWPIAAPRRFPKADIWVAAFGKSGYRPFVFQQYEKHHYDDYPKPDFAPGTPCGWDPYRGETLNWGGIGSSGVSVVDQAIRPLGAIEQGIR